MAGGPYVADSGGVRISGALSYELGGSIVSYGWDINNDNVTDYNQSTVKLTLQELQDKELIEASANSITLEVTDDLGAKSKTTTEIRIPYAWSSIITSTSTTFTSTTTTTSTTSTSTTSTTLPLIKDICLGGDLSVVGFAGVIPHC